MRLKSVVVVQLLPRSFTGFAGAIAAEDEGLHELVSNRKVLKGVLFDKKHVKITAQDVVQMKGNPKKYEVLHDPEVACESRDLIMTTEGKKEGLTSIVTNFGASFSWKNSEAASELKPFVISCNVLSDVESSHKSYSHSFVHHKLHATQVVELDLKHVELEVSVVKLLANTLLKPKKDWIQTLREFLLRYGTHYCPTVVLGGFEAMVVTLESSEVFEKNIVERGLRQCVDAEFAGANGCKEVAQLQNDTTKEVMQQASINRLCSVPPCAMSDDELTNKMKGVNNWRVVDRSLDKCIPIWFLMRRPDDKERIVKAAVKAGTEIDADDLKDELDELCGLMQKVWSTEIFDLQAKCNLLPALRNNQQCESLSRAIRKGYNSMIKLQTEDINKIWNSIQEWMDKHVDWNSDDDKLNTIMRKGVDDLLQMRDDISPEFVEQAGYFLVGSFMGAVFVKGALYVAGGTVLAAAAPPVVIPLAVILGIAEGFRRLNNENEIAKHALEHALVKWEKYRLSFQILNMESSDDPRKMYKVCALKNHPDKWESGLSREKQNELLQKYKDCVFAKEYIIAFRIKYSKDGRYLLPYAYEDQMEFLNKFLTWFQAKLVRHTDAIKNTQPSRKLKEKVDAELKKYQEQMKTEV